MWQFDGMWQFVVNNWYLLVGLVVVLGLLLYDPISRLLYGIRGVPPLQVPQVMSHESAVIIDVGEPKEFKAGHISNAINLPLGSLRADLGRLEKYKDKPIVVVCPNGNRSAKGAMILRRNGFSTVYNLIGGMRAWERENLPVEK